MKTLFNILIPIFFFLIPAHTMAQDTLYNKLDSLARMKDKVGQTNVINESAYNETTKLTFNSAISNNLQSTMESTPPLIANNSFPCFKAGLFLRKFSNSWSIVLLIFKFQIQLSLLINIRHTPSLLSIDW